MRVGKGECLTHLNDLYALELNDMKWEEVDVNSEQPRPYGRKSHTATFVGTRLFVFGGHAWVPDHDADNEYGMTSKAVGDLWYINLAGDGPFRGRRRTRQATRRARARATAPRTSAGGS